MEVRQKAPYRGQRQVRFHAACIFKGDPGLTVATLPRESNRQIDMGPELIGTLVDGFAPYKFLEAEGYTYAIRLKANAVLRESITHLLSRPVGRPPNHVCRFHASFSYQAGSWNKKRRVVAKVEWHPGELVPRVGFIVTNLSRPTKRVVAFYNHRGTAEQHIKEGKNAINWTRLSCRKFRNNAVRLQLHALAYNMGSFMRTLALPKEVEHWSLTTLREKLVKIGAKVVSHGQYVTFQLAGVAVPRERFRKILRLIDGPRPAPLPP
jgi:hypothetical protein